MIDLDKFPLSFANVKNRRVQEIICLSLCASLRCKARLLSTSDQKKKYFTEGKTKEYC